MIEIFYYIGLLCLASCIEELINIKQLKKTNRLNNETINDNVENIKSIEGKELSENLESIGDTYKKTVKKINPIRAVIGFMTLFWNIAGIFITEQKMFFAVLLLITFSAPYFIRLSTKDEKQQLILSYITNIVSLIFVCVISYNHFFKHIL